MATLAHYLPSSTGSYTTQSGEIRLKFWYNWGTDTNNNVAAKINKLGKLKIPLEVTPSDQSFRFASMKIKFEYHSDLDSLATAAKTIDVFCDVIKDGNLFWRGLVDPDLIKKTGYYYTSGLQYKYIEYHLIDAFSYFLKNNVLLSDLSSNGAGQIKTVFQEIAAEIGFSSSDVDIDTGLTITEPGGSVYNFQATTGSLKIIPASSMPVNTFLKNFMLSLGVFIYNLNGEVKIVRRIGGTLKTISTSDIRKIDKIPNTDNIKFVKLESTLDTTFLLGDNILDSVTHDEEYGTESAETQKNFEVVDDGILNKIYADVAAGEYPSGGATIDTGGTDFIVDSSENFYTGNVETGDVVYYDYAGTQVAGSIIDSRLTTILAKFFDTAITAQTGEAYSIKFGDGISGTVKRWKFELLVKMAAAIYEEYFLTGDDIHKLTLKSIDDYSDISKRFTIFSANHRTKNASIDFATDQINFELLEVD